VCEDIDTLAMLYLDGELAGAEVRELEAHLVVCEACRQRVDAARAGLAGVRALALRAPDAVAGRVRAALDGEDRRRRRHWLAWLVPGAAALLVLIVALDSRAPSRPPHPQPPLQPPPVGALRPAAIAPLELIWTARWIHDRDGRRELVELWRVRDHAGNEVILEIRIVLPCAPAPALTLRQYI
jgi:anti-sigma factor RsiW